MSSRSTVAHRTFLAMSCLGASLAPAAANAQSAGDGHASGDVVVNGTAIDTSQQLESPKRTRSVRDTPQTITVLNREVIEEQNLLTLRDVLSTLPGITFGAGEGGGGYGDSINFRGYSANNDITIDGVRDSAQYTRTDPFNLEQVEVTNGANSVISGAGSVGGNVNLITKRPEERDAYLVTAGGGTADYARGTIDFNKRLGDIAVRLNGMAHRNDVPGRDVENYKRWGIAPALTIGIATPTRLIFQYVHQEDTNIPQYGVPYYVSATNNGPVPGVDRSDYFGYRNIDRQRIIFNQLTNTFEHEFDDGVSIRNLARWEDVRQFTLVDPPQGTYCLANNLTPTGAACTATLGTPTVGANRAPVVVTVPGGYYLPTGPRGTTRITRNQLLFDQVDVKAVFKTGPIEHTIDLGGAATWERFDLSTGNSQRNADGTSPYLFNPAAPSATQHLPYVLITDPNTVVPGPAVAGAVYGSNVYTGPVSYIQSGTQYGEQTNYAVYAFDTMKLGKVELNGGVRVERNSGVYRADTFSTVTTTLGAYTRGTPVNNANTLVSYRIGLTYKPVEQVTLYAAYGNSQTPSKASVNGSCTVAGVNGATASTCNVDPETAKNYEVGVKADLGAGVLLSLSAFRNDRDQYKVASNDPTLPDQTLDGFARVDGISASAIGKITQAWQVTANYTYLRSKLIQSVSNFCLAHPGATGCANSVAFPDPGAGSHLANTPEQSGSLFTTYKLPFGLTVGYGMTYQGSYYFGTATLTGTTLAAPFKSSDYLIHQAYLSYDITKRINAQVNVKNFTDKLYYTRIRNNGWATPGDGRSAVFTINAKF